MHRKFLFLLFTFFLSIPLFAQLEVKEDSFKEVAGFVNINTEIMYDDNDKPYAVKAYYGEYMTQYSWAEKTLVRPN